MAALPEVLEEHVASEAESRRSDRTPGVTRAQLRDHMCQVARLAGVIEARETVGLAAAAAEVHPHAPKAPDEEMMEHLGHVAPPRRPLESVQQDDDGRPRRGCRRLVQIEKVAVRSPYPATLQGEGGAGSQVPPRKGLRVRVAEPPCGPEGGGRGHWAATLADSRGCVNEKRGMGPFARGGRSAPPW